MIQCRLLARVAGAAIAFTCLAQQSLAQDRATLPAQARRTPPFISPSGRVYRATASAPDPRAAWFAFTDRNHDGAIDMAEMRAEAGVLFAELDVDHDGEIDPTEITRYETIVAPETQAGLGGFASDDERPAPTQGADAAPMPAGMGGKLSSRPRGAGAYGLLNIPQPVASADTDMNRGVTSKEMQAAADRRFRMLDPEGTGKLTLASLARPAAGADRNHRRR